MLINKLSTASAVHLPAPQMTANRTSQNSDAILHAAVDAECLDPPSTNTRLLLTVGRQVSSDGVEVPPPDDGNDEEHRQRAVDIVPASDELAVARGGDEGPG